MSRSLKKGPYIDAKLLKKVRRQEEEGVNEVIRTWARSCTVIPEFIARTFEVHNGRGFQRVLIAEDMVGHKLGEFAPTRTYRGHGKEKGKTAKA